MIPQGQRSRGYLVHLTSVENLASIWGAGAILADSQLSTGQVTAELGSRDIKNQRRRRPVPCGAGGVVGDYVPFYFSARSPMLYFAHTGNPLSPFAGPQADLVHLVSHSEVVSELGLRYVYSDRNAALALARFSDDLAEIDQLVDWKLQQQKFWNSTDAEPDRMERRMAEFLVHEACPISAILELGVLDDASLSKVSVTLDGSHPPIKVQPSWYY
jgi:hypothetical protein